MEKPPGKPGLHASLSSFFSFSILFLVSLQSYAIARDQLSHYASYYHTQPTWCVPLPIIFILSLAVHFISFRVHYDLDMTSQDRIKVFIVFYSIYSISCI